MLALNECVSRITAQREKAALEAEAQQLGKDVSDYLARTGK